MSVSRANYNDGLVHKEPSFKHGACVLLPTKEDARNALDLLMSIVKRYGFVSVYDLYLAIGAKGTTEDDMIGWESLEGSCIKSTYGKREYRLILPKLNHDEREYVRE